MNLGFADQALDSFMTVDIDWMQHFYTGQTKLPDSSQWSSNSINDELEMELLHIINAANKRSRTIAAPAINTAAMGSWDLAACTMGSWKPELDMCRNAALHINSFDASPVSTTAVPRSSCSLITKNLPAALNTSALHEYPPVYRSDPPPLQPAEATGGLCRGVGVPKPKKKRIRPSRRVPTTVVKTDTSNFKAMVQHFTGIPPTSTVTTQESTEAPPASSFPESTSSATSPSFSKPLPHPVLCKISNSSLANPKSTASASITACSSPLLSSSIPTRQSLPELPFPSTVASITGSDQIPNSADSEEQANMPLIDAAFFEKLWSEINSQPMGRNL
jgi:hypothetical protein